MLEVLALICGWSLHAGHCCLFWYDGCVEVCSELAMLVFAMFYDNHVHWDKLYTHMPLLAEFLLLFHSVGPKCCGFL